MIGLAHRAIYRRLLILLLPLLILVASIATYRAVIHTPREATQSGGRNIWKLKPGDRLVYDLKYESDSFSDLQALYGSVSAGAERDARRAFPHAYHVTVDCRAALTAIKRNGARIVASYRF